MRLLPPNTPPFLTVAHFVKITGSSRALAYRLINRGDLVALRLGDRGAIRIPRTELEQFLQSRLVA